MTSNGFGSCDVAVPIRPTRLSSKSIPIKATTDVHRFTSHGLLAAHLFKQKSSNSFFMIANKPKNE